MVTVLDLNPHLRTINKRDVDVEQPKPEKRKRGRPKKTDKK